MISTETQENLEIEVPEFAEVEYFVEESDTKEYNFAQMNGVSIDFTAPEEALENNLPEPEEIVTTRTVSQNPLLKVVVIGGVVLILILLVGGIINGSMNAFKLATTKKIEPDQKPQQETEQTVKDETGTDKTALALTRQSMEMQKMREMKAKPTPAATPTQAPTSQPVSVKPTPTQPQPVTRPQPTYTRPVERPSYSYRRIETPPQPRVVTRSPIQPIQPQPKPQLQTTTTVVKAPVDPMQQWLAVSNVGSFSTNQEPERPDISISQGTERIEGGVGKPPTSFNVASKDKQTRKRENVNYGSQRILVGTRAEGKLETPIVWTQNNEAQSQKYLIRLSNPLKTSTGSEVLPKNSYIVAQIPEKSQSEYIQLQAVSALVNNNGNTEEKNLPEGSILILAKNGKLLKAETRKGNDLGGMILSSVLTGVVKAAEIQNRPSSQVITNSNGFSSSTISNDNKDIMAGFTEGTLGAIVQEIQSNNQRYNQQFESEERVFVIEAGKEVQIFVNETISL